MTSTRLPTRNHRPGWLSLVILAMGLLLVAPSAFAGDEESDDGEAQARDDDDDDAPKIKDRIKPRTGTGTPADALERATGAGPATTTAEGDTTGADPAPAADGDDDDDDDDDASDEPEPWRGDGDSPATSDPATPPRRVVEPLPGDVRINIDYDDVEIKDIIKDFAHKTGRNFLVDGKISGKITIHAPRAVSVDEAYEAFIVALDSAGYTTVVEARFQSGPNRGKPMLTRILPAADAKTEPLELYRSGRSIPNSAHLITRLVQVDNVSVDEMSRILQKWVSKDGDIVAYPPSNTLIITDSANNIRRMVELIEELDISAPKQKLEVIQIEFAEAAQVLAIVQEIYGVDAAATGRSAPAASSASSRAAERRAARRASRGRSSSPGSTATTTAGSASATSVGKEGSFVSKMIADERTNTILVLATEKSIEEIKALIEEIDYEVDPSANADIHVIYLEHAKAEELSSTLNSLTQQSSRTSAATRRTGTAAAGTAAGRAAAADRGAASGAGQPGSLGGNFVGEVRITHDVPTNSLVITASRDDYTRLKRVIDLLDIPRKQVFVETVIMEVSDTRVNDNGISWHGGGLGSGAAGGSPVSIIGARGSGSISPAASLLDGSLLAGLGLGIFGEALNVALPGVEGGLEIPAFGVVLRFLQEDQSTNVLSSPNILTLDNEEATIEIGETVPFPTGGLLGGLGGLAGAAGGASGLGGIPSVSFTREDVGIILRITPQINESDWVTLDIYQEISEVKEGSTTDSLSTGGPTTTKRSAETHVSVRSNQTVVIGGLMQEVETESESKVPILGDIPLIGALFRNKRKTKRKTNLLIFLTPHVIDTPEDLQEVYLVKMLQREEFMRRFYGKTAEEQMDELNQLIRYSMNLPGQPPVYSDPEPPRGDVTIEGIDPDDADLLRAIEALDEIEGEVLITPDGEVDLDAYEEDEPYEEEYETEPSEDEEAPE